MLPSLFIHTYMSNILLLFLLQETIQIFVHLKTILYIYRIDIICLASHPSFLVPVGSRALNQPIHRVVLAKCNIIVFVFFKLYSKFNL